MVIVRVVRGVGVGGEVARGQGTLVVGSIGGGDEGACVEEGERTLG